MMAEEPRRSRRARLVLLSEFVDGVQNSTGYYWSKIIDGLAAEFEDICVICPRSSYLKVAAAAANVVYVTFPDRVFDKNMLASRLAGQLSLTFHFCKALLAHAGGEDVVFSGTNPALSLLFTAIIKRIRGFKWMILVHDVFPENLVAADIVRRKSLSFWILKWLFDRAYLSADTLIAIGRDMLELLREKTGAQRRVVYIPNWVDPIDVLAHPRGMSPLFEGRAWQDKVVFQYFGNFGRVQGLPNLLQALRCVKNPRAAFIFIGSGALGSAISRFIVENPSIDLICSPALAIADTNIGLSACDVAIVPLAKGVKGLAVPSKAYFSLAADKPILVVSDEGSELHQLVSEEVSIGWFCKPESPVALAELIDAICDMRLDSFRGKSRAVLLAKYSYANSVRQYSQCVMQLGLLPDRRRA
jgi:glycosyltransferase involved in cell wall biosynthesis